MENELADKSVPEILKAITMKYVVYWIAAAWEEASIGSLRNWHNLLCESDPDEVQDWVGTPSESSYIAAGPLLLFQMCNLVLKG